MWIVVGLLLLVFRAPLVSVVPLATLYCIDAVPDAPGLQTHSIERHAAVRTEQQPRQWVLSTLARRGCSAAVLAQPGPGLLEQLWRDEWFMVAGEFYPVGPRAPFGSPDRRSGDFISNPPIKLSLADPSPDETAGVRWMVQDAVNGRLALTFPSR